MTDEQRTTLREEAQVAWWTCHEDVSNDKLAVSALLTLLTQVAHIVNDEVFTSYIERIELGL